MLPIATVVLIGWLVVIQLHFDMYAFIVNFFSPLNSIAQSLPGMILLYLIPTILYSMGISGWVFQPILNPIALVAITANADALAAGLHSRLPMRRSMHGSALVVAVQRCLYHLCCYSRLPSSSRLLGKLQSCQAC